MHESTVCPQQALVAQNIEHAPARVKTRSPLEGPCSLCFALRVVVLRESAIHYVAGVV